MWTLCDMRPRLRPRGAGRQQHTAAPGTLPVSVQRPPTGSQAGTRPPWQKRAAGRRGPLATCAPGAGQLAPLRLASGPAPREGPPGRSQQRPLRGDTRLPTAGSRPPKGCWPATPTATPTAPPTRAGDRRARSAGGGGGGGGALTPSMSEGWSRHRRPPPSPAVQADPVLSRLPAQAVPDQRLHTWLCKTPDPEANATATGTGRRLASPSSVKRRPRRRPRCCGLAVQRAWGRPGSRPSVSLRGRPRGKGAWLSSPDTPASPPQRGDGRNLKRHVPLLLLLV